MRVTPVRWLFPFLCALSLHAGEQTIVLREPLGQGWTNELVSFAFEARKGTCAPESVTLAGQQGPLPVQLSEVQFWPTTRWDTFWSRGPSVRSARLWFKADLKPRATDTYTVSYGPVPVAAPPTDLTVTPGPEQAEIATRRFGLRVWLGEKTFAEPIPASEAPGPLRAMRLEDGTWFGGSSLYGTQTIAACSVRITESGPVLAEVAMHYRYADGTSMNLTARLAAGDAQAVWTMDCDSDLATAGWRLALTPGLDPLHFTAIPEFYENRWGKFEMVGGKWVGTSAEVDLTQEPAGFLVNLVPWDGWWDQQNKRSFTFHIPGRGDVFFIGSRDAGEWKDPAPGSELAMFPYGDAAMRKRWVPLNRGADGALYFDFNASQGRRRWQCGAVSASPAAALGGLAWPAERYQRLDSLLNDYALDWPQDPKRTHPLMYLSRAQVEAAWKRPADLGSLYHWDLVKDAAVPSAPNWTDSTALGAYLLTGDPQVAAQGKVVERLRHHLELFGGFDLMRSPLVVAALYDALIDSSLIAPDDRPVLRAQMAWLAYRLADPANWSAERGYCSGNLNMTVAHVLQLGQIGCLLSDHPMAATWARPALAMMDKWLNELGPEGEHVESVANYAHVSASTMLTFAIAARNAGLRDYVNDSRMKKLMLFLAKQYTPPDPRSGGNRKPGFSRLPPAGRGPAGQRWDLPAVMARATADSDPEYSRALQWVWLQEGSPGNADARLGGYEYIYNDTSLPAANPHWGSDLFPAYGAILRLGWGTTNAYCINFQAHIGDGYPSANGSFPVIYAKGTLLSTVFSEGYIDREELLISKVLPARPRGTTEERNASFYHRQEEKLAAFASLSRQDYTALDVVIKEPVAQKIVESAGHHGQVFVPAAWPPVPVTGKAPIRWQRQVLFLKGDEAAGAGYLLLRDTVSGGQPTMWQFWTLSEKVGTPEDVADRAAFLADRPGNRVAEPRELKGDRFTAVGQFGVDLEYFVASPRATPRHTLRAGEEYAFFDFCNGTCDYQDLLHLQMPGDGAYYVALFPRRPGEPVPAFAALGDGTIVKVSGEFGTDYGFLSATKAEAAAEGVSFRGTAASVQNRAGGLVLLLGAKGEVRCPPYGVAADFPTSLRVGEAELIVELPEKMQDYGQTVKHPELYGWAGRQFFPLEPWAGGAVTVTSPGNWALAKPLPGLRLTTSGEGFVLEVPGGLKTVSLIRGN